MNSIIRVLGFVTVLSLGMGLPAKAQDAAPPKGITVTVVTIAPGTGQAFEAIPKNTRKRPPNWKACLTTLLILR